MSMTTELTELGGTAVEVLPCAGGGVLVVTTDLATGTRTAALDGAVIGEGDIDGHLTRWHADHPQQPQQGADGEHDDSDQGARQAQRVALVRARAFRGARGGG